MIKRNFFQIFSTTNPTSTSIFIYFLFFEKIKIKIYEDDIQNYFYLFIYYFSVIVLRLSFNVLNFIISYIRLSYLRNANFLRSFR